MLQAMDELTALYDQLVDEDMTDYQKVKAIYEGVMARTDYNNTVFHKYQGSSDWDAMLSDPEFVLSQTWLGVVKGADVVCGGYSQAVSSLLDLAGIPNFVVTSYSSDMSHAWNKVLLDGKWYNLDATWGDGGISPSSSCAATRPSSGTATRTTAGTAPPRTRCSSPPSRTTAETKNALEQSSAFFQLRHSRLCRRAFTFFFRYHTQLNTLPRIRMLPHR